MATRKWNPEISRRTFLGMAGVGAGLVATGGVGSLNLLGRGPEAGWSFRETAVALWKSLSPPQRAAICLPYDHPARQVLNHVVCVDVPHLASVLDFRQRMLAQHLYATMTSDAHRHRFGALVGLEAGGLDPCSLVFYGDPRTARCQVSLNGGHLLIRGGGMTEAGSAFGGPLAYGHQIGNGVPRLPGSAFAYHGDAANAVFAKLSRSERGRALSQESPHNELVVQLQSRGGSFPGLPVRDLDDALKQDVASLVDTVLSCYDERDRADALRCLDRNGGVESLHLAAYAEGGIYDDGALFQDLGPDERARRGEPYWHVWQLEGPGSLLHFRGWPHLHASIHIADHAGAGQNVGEVIAESDALVEGEALRGLLLAALRETSGAPHAFVMDPLRARMCPGPITTGLAWSLDPFGDTIVVATLRGRDATDAFRAQLAAQGDALEPGRTYRVAASEFVTSTFASRRPDRLGDLQEVEPTGIGTRQAYESYLRGHGPRVG